MTFEKDFDCSRVFRTIPLSSMMMDIRIPKNIDGNRRDRLFNLEIFVGYGKSPILSNVRKAIATIARLRPEKFRSTDSQPGDHVNVVSDETTAAGILSSLKGCTRLLAPDEGDEVFRDLGLTQSYSQGARS